MTEWLDRANKPDDDDSTMSDSKLIPRLERIRTTVRRRLLVYGVMAVVAGGIASFLTVSAADWLLRLPSPLRLVAAGLFLLGAAGAVLHWVIRPQRARIDTAEIARQLERRFHELRDRLSSTVHFLEHGTGKPACWSGSEPMARRVIENTDAETASLPLESALSLVPLARCGAWLGCSALVFCTVLWSAPDWARTGLYRYIDPFGAIEWPRRVWITPLTKAETVAMGESVTVRMAVERGMRDSLRAFVHVREPNGEVVLLAAQRDRDGTFFAIVDAVTTNLEYWFEAGDASTRSHPFAIRVVRRPEVVEAIAEVAPPPYASVQTHTTHSLAEGLVHAPVGGSVKLVIRSSKPITPDAGQARAGLRFADGSYKTLAIQPAGASRLAGEPDPQAGPQAGLPVPVPASDPRTLSVELDIVDDIVFHVELRDENGFGNRGAARYEIRAVPDAPPSVRIMAPLAVTESTPNGSIVFSITVEDDLGVSSLFLNVEQMANGKHSPVDLTDILVAAPDSEHTWLADMNLQLSTFSAVPGDDLVCTAVASDNRCNLSRSLEHTRIPAQASSCGSDMHQVRRSAPVRIKVISEAEFDVRVRDELAALEGRLRRVLLAQTELLDGTRSLVRSDMEPSPLTGEETEQVNGMTSRQARLARRLQDIANRFTGLKTRLEENRAGQPTMLQTLDAATDSLRQVATGEMRKAAGFLLAAGNPVLPVIQQTALSDASQNQAAALDQLRALLASMAQLGDYQTLVSRTRDLLDLQNELRTRTQQLGKSLLGKAIGSLGTENAAALRRLQRQQEQLAGEVDRLLARLRRSNNTQDKKDTSAQEAIDDAIRSARTSKLQHNVNSAAEAIAANRTAVATIEQKAAADGLRRMLRALQKRQDRALARLRKTVRDAATQVAQLLEEENDLRHATHEAILIASDQAILADFGDRQRTIGNNTRALGGELEERMETFDAARMLRSAVDEMKVAEIGLGSGNTASAQEGQDRAVAALGEALELLNALDEHVAKESMRRTLNEIRGALESIAQAERAIDDSVRVLHESIHHKGRIARSQAREAARLARDQHAVRRQVDEWLPEFKEVKVFEWSLRRVSEWMDRGRRQLDNRQIDERLLQTVARIVRDLEKLIGAIDDTLNLPDPEFAEAEEGSGAAGRGGAAGQDSKKPVPTVTELLVLKSLQHDIAERTRSMHGEIRGDELDEGQLRAIVELGEDQADIGSMTEMLTRLARQE